MLQLTNTDMAKIWARYGNVKTKYKDKGLKGDMREICGRNSYEIIPMR